MENKVVYFFEQVSQIPRSSGHEKEIANFLVNFAKERNLFVKKDNFNNVLIKKNGKGKPIILQAHMDMVCVSEPDYDIDFLTKPIKLQTNGDYLSAYKTSLGADNGIGVAMILSLLDENNDYSIEALFTTDEEVTMTGALNFDYSQLNSNKMIGLDGFSEYELINGCASICDMKVKFKPTFRKCEKEGYELLVSGLKGGHSGSEINKDIGNAIQIASLILSSLEDVELQNFESGNQFNFIPNIAKLQFSSNSFDKNFNTIKETLCNKYSSLKLSYKKIKIKECLDNLESNKIISFIYKAKTGVILQGSNCVVLSQNIAYINLKNGLIKISQRGHDEDKDNSNIFRLKTLANNYGYEFEIFDKQPGFQTGKNSSLVKDLVLESKKFYSKPLNVVNKHISLEACIFKQKMPNLDVAIISPTILDMHSTKERVFLPSIDKIYNLLKSYLDRQR